MLLHLTIFAVKDDHQDLSSPDCATSLPPLGGFIFGHASTGGFRRVVAQVAALMFSGFVSAGQCRFVLVFWVETSANPNPP